MKKIVLWLVVLAVLVVGGYYGAGLVTERTLTRNVALINDTSGLSVQVKDYVRGLFSSRVYLVWKIQTPEQLIKNADGVSTLLPSKTISFDMPLDVYHGPVMYTPRGFYFGLGYGFSEINLPAEYEAQFKQRFAADSIQPKLDLAVFISFLAQTHVSVNIPSFRVATQQNGEQFEWLGLSSDHRFSSSLAHISGSFTLNGLRGGGHNERVVLDKMTSSYDLHRNDNGLYLGNLSFSAPSMVLIDQNKPLFELTGFELSNSSDVEGVLFDASIHAAFKTLLLNSKQYGPGRVGFSIKNLDAAVLAEMNDKVNAAQQLSDTARQQALFALLPMLPSLFSKGAEIEVNDLNLVVSEGVVEGKFALQLPQDSGTNLFQLLQKIVGEGELKLPTAALNALLVQSVQANLAKTSAAVEPPVNPDQSTALAVKQKIAALTATGALVVEGSDYVIRVKIAGGQLLVNGHPFESAMLQF